MYPDKCSDLGTYRKRGARKGELDIHRSPEERKLKLEVQFAFIIPNFQLVYGFDDD
jgi:hypothetical protein